MNKIVIVDYGMGNLYSVLQALRYVAPEANIHISNTVNMIKSADRIILPGQGAMPDCMRCLHKSNLYDAIITAARNKPLFGVCVGEQMLFDWSEEGNTLGLGLFSGKVVRFQFDSSYMVQKDASQFKIPQIGWNRVCQNVAHPLWSGIDNYAYFYFIHSYYAQPKDFLEVVGETIYGKTFASAIAKDNIFATQFHPEKSAFFGLKLYWNFVHWKP